MDKYKYDHIVVRYGELSLKGKNRKDFTKALSDNIKKRLKDYEKLEFKTLYDAIFIKLNDESYEDIKEKLKTVFGYSHFSGAIISSLDLEEVKKICLELVLKGNYKTFKVQAKRSNKNYPTRSDEINRIIASHILKNSSVKVDVHNPDLTIYVVVKEDSMLIMDEKIKGYGGYPTGVNGRAMLMMSGGIDSPVAGFMTMKRGLKIECIHFASMPYTSKQALEKVFSLTKIISEYQEDVIVHVIPFTDLQLAIYKHVAEPYCVTIMRRMMYRIADKLCEKRNIKVITNGESVGQVASQTPESISVIGKVSNTLILRPLCMMDKIEIIDIARKIGTYETSILPYEDCCTIFDPKNPTTKPKDSECEFYESKFDYNEMVNKCIDNDEIIKISYRNKQENIY